MALQIVLTESDLLRMDKALSDKLINWYLEDRRSNVGSPPSPDLGSINATGTVQVSPLREEAGRVSFPNLCGPVSSHQELISLARRSNVRSVAARRPISTQERCSPMEVSNITVSII